MRNFKELNVSFHSEPFCEHCGNLEPYDAMFDDGENWCMDCYPEFDLTDEEVIAVTKEECLSKIKHFNTQIHLLQTKMKNLE